MNKPRIGISNLTVSYGNKIALQNISLDIFPSEIVSIVGPNGGGKTTLLQVILGMKTYDSGEIRVMGQQPGKVPSGTIGYLPQAHTHSVNFPIRVRDVVLMGRHPRLGLFHRPGAADRDIVHNSLEIVDMLPQIDHPIQALSGGQKQRVFIARALAMDPQILIMDEPSTGLDAIAQEDFYQTLVRLREEREMSILMVSHDVGVVSNYVDKIACLNRQIHYHGPASEAIPDKVIQKVFGRNIQILVHNKDCISCRETHGHD